jgi:hypothetical protein
VAEVFTAAEDSMVVPRTLPAEALEAADSVARTAADTSASNEFKKRPIGRFFLTSMNESRSSYFHFL